MAAELPARASQTLQTRQILSRLEVRRLEARLDSLEEQFKEQQRALIDLRAEVVALAEMLARLTPPPPHPAPAPSWINYVNRSLRRLTARFEGRSPSPGRARPNTEMESATKRRRMF